MPYYVPFKPIDVVTQGRVRWNRRKHWRRKAGFFTNQTYWVAEPALAPFITGYGVLISKVYHKYTGVTPALMNIYSGFQHDLARILAKLPWKNEADGERYFDSTGGWWKRAYYSYKIPSDLFNAVNGRSIRAIVSASARLTEDNLSATERAQIDKMIAQSSNMVCIYDFRRDYLYKPPR